MHGRCEYAYIIIHLFLCGRFSFSVRCARKHRTNEKKNEWGETLTSKRIYFIRCVPLLLFSRTFFRHFLCVYSILHSRWQIIIIHNTVKISHACKQFELAHLLYALFRVLRSFVMNVLDINAVFAVVAVVVIIVIVVAVVSLSFLFARFENELRFSAGLCRNGKSIFTCEWVCCAIYTIIHFGLKQKYICVIYSDAYATLYVQANANSIRL